MLTPGELLERIRFWRNADRLGPDIPWTHWRLHFKSTMTRICKEKFAHFGEGAEFRPGAYAVSCSRIWIGANVVVRPGSMLFADPRPEGVGITIDDGVLLGSGVHIYVANHRFGTPGVPIIGQGHDAAQAVVLQRGCWIGANAILLPGVEVGEGAVVGAGSIVTTSVPARVVVTGSPAKVVRSLG
jgi:acetyltransferase-like isoleucine patch superfamily enzyme